VDRLHSDLKKLLALFSSNRVEYLIVGGHAVAFHGHPRFTEDLDCYVRPSVENGSRIVQALREFGFGSLNLDASDFVAHDRMIQLGRAPNRIDLLSYLYAVTFDEAWSRKVEGVLDGVSVWFMDRESLLRNKRATGRPQDLADVDFLERLKPLA
jgi:hypothetical protein